MLYSACVRFSLLAPIAQHSLDRELLAWAAGFFDGEGSTIARRDARRDGYRQIQLSVPQSGPNGVPEVLRTFQVAALGTGRIDGPAASDMWVWRTRGRADAQAVLALLWPYLGEVKRAQARRATSLVEDRYATGRRHERADRHIPTFTAHPSTTSRSEATEDVLERAWAAGFLDAEGSFGLIRAGARRRGPDWYRIRISASQHSPDGAVPPVLVRLQRVLGVGRIERHGELDDFKWLAEGREPVLRALELTESWLGSVKRAQAEASLAAFEAQTRLRSTSPATCLRGHPYERVVTGAAGGRRKVCLACARLLARRQRRAHGIAPRAFRNVKRRYAE